MNKSEWIRVEDMHDAIISKSEFDLVQESLLKDTRVVPEQTEVFSLAGMVFCADCGEPMVRKTVPAGGKRYVYYVCSGNKKTSIPAGLTIYPKRYSQIVRRIL